MTSGQIPPERAGQFLRSSRFGENVGIFINVDTNIRATSIDVIPNRLDIPNRQAFNSGAFGQPNDAEIWGCKSGVVATQLVLLEALAKNMSETVPEGHPDWKNRIDSLNVALQKAYTEAFGLCNAVDPAVVPPQK